MSTTCTCMYEVRIQERQYVSPLSHRKCISVSQFMAAQPLSVSRPQSDSALGSLSAQFSHSIGLPSYHDHLPRHAEHSTSVTCSQPHGQPHGQPHRLCVRHSPSHRSRSIHVLKRNVPLVGCHMQMCRLCLSSGLLHEVHEHVHVLRDEKICRW